MKPTIIFGVFRFLNMNQNNNETNQNEGFVSESAEISFGCFESKPVSRDALILPVFIYNRA